MQISKIICVVGAILCGFIGYPVHGQDIQSVAALEQQLQSFLGKDRGEPNGASHAIDRRLRLKKCPAPPVLEKRNEDAVLIRCVPLNWRISVPLARKGQSRDRTSHTQIIVKRGQPVLLVAQKNGFLVSRQMHADRNGRLGDIIPVRATRKSRPILAEIVGQGRVALPSF